MSNRSKSYSITLAARLVASARGILAIILEQHLAQILGRRPKARLRLHIGSTERDDAVLVAKSKLLPVDRRQLLEGIGRETVGREKQAPSFFCSTMTLRSFSTAPEPTFVDERQCLIST
jgi:hypothetical protein